MHSREEWMAGVVVSGGEGDEESGCSRLWEVVCFRHFFSSYIEWLTYVVLYSLWRLVLMGE